MSYKYAVLLALVDSCLEGLTQTGEPPEDLHARAVGDKVLELYWRQAMPYPSRGETRVLRQRPELRKLDLVARVAAFRESVGFDRSMAEAHAADPGGSAALHEQGFVTIVRMPLPKLQRMNRDDPFGDGFLYRIGWPNEVSESRVRRAGFGDLIHLMPASAGCWSGWPDSSVRSCNAVGRSSSPAATPTSSTTSPSTSSSSEPSGSGTSLWAAPDAYRTVGRDRLRSLLIARDRGWQAAEERPPHPYG